MHQCLIAVIFTAICGFFSSVNAINCKGCTPLDTYSFDKILTKFKATLVKFDVAYPYGEKHEQYGKVAEATRGVQDLLIAEVNIKDYGEKDNSDLAEKYDIKTKDFPVIKLFRKGMEPFLYQGTFKQEDIIHFIKLHTGVYIGLPGCIEQYDNFASEFVAAKSNREKRLNIIKDTKKLIEKEDNTKHAEMGTTYLKLMEKIVEKGDEFVTNEITRLDNLRKSKVSIEKKESLQRRMNILQSFIHDEL